jgi:hypothetical protein
MTSPEKEEQIDKEEKILKLIRSLANGVGVILFIVMLIVAFEQGGLERLIDIDGRETITFVCVLTMFFGIIWAHSKEIAGGILIVVAYIVMAINMGKLFPDAILPIFLVVGLLHLYVGFVSFKRSS